MRFGLVVILVTLVSLILAACGPQGEVQDTTEAEGDASEPAAKTVEVTREVTVERTVVSRPESPSGSGEGGSTREALPGPAVPSETDINRTVGQTATLDSGNSVTVFSGQSGVPQEDSVYKPRAGMDFFVIEAEVCVPEDATEPSYFTPREFNLLNDDTVRRMASVPTQLPALRGDSAEPGECNRGYITFQVEEGEEPQAVVYEGSSVVEWELGEG
ncbi:MAG: hypothetical protein WA982_16520 [Rubrobacteraceae bacterium]